MENVNYIAKLINDCFSVIVSIIKNWIWEIKETQLLSGREANTLSLGRFSLPKNIYVESTQSIAIVKKQKEIVIELWK